MHRTDAQTKCGCTFNLLVSSMPKDCRQALYDGTCFQLDDKGSLYSILKEEEMCDTPSCSSHASTGNQYRCKELGYPLLFATSELGTWFQLERYPITHPCHVCTCCIFKCCAVNTGPTGTSWQTPDQPRLMHLSWDRMRLKMMINDIY